MASPAEELDVAGVPVRLTSPDKPYFSALGEAGTKRHLVEFYRTVATMTGTPLVTALRNRPDLPATLPGRDRG